MTNVELGNYQETDYSNLFGGQQESAELIKAMIAGDTTGRDTTNQLLTQEPLKAESLEKTLKLLEFRMKDVKLWNAVPKMVAYNTVEEYIQLESYGTDRGGFYGEGELSDVEDSKYRRRAELVKYIQVTGEVTLQAQMVRSYVDAMRKEVENKTMWVIRKVSSALTKADSNIVPKEFNGIYAQHASIGSAEGDIYADLDTWQDSTSVIDMRGASMTQSTLEDAATQVDANFGNVDTFFAPPSVMSGLFKDYFERQRIILGGSTQGGTFGTVPTAIGTQFGNVAIQQDKFMKKTAPRLATDNPTSAKAPAQPTSTSATLVSDSKSRFKATDHHTGELGSVFYAVAAINEYGESSLEIIGTDTTKTVTAAGQSVDLIFAAAASSYPATGFVIYRSKISTVTNAATSRVPFYPLFKVSIAQLAAGYDGAAALAVRDRNRFLPDTEDGFATEMAEEVLSFKQLAPISKLDLAVLAPANRFITFLWGTVQLYTQKKLLRVINIGPFVAA